MGVTGGSLFPGLDGGCKELKARFLKGRPEAPILAITLRHLHDCHQCAAAHVRSVIAILAGPQKHYPKVDLMVTYPR
jgi:hypothetical protein